MAKSDEHTIMNDTSLGGRVWFSGGIHFEYYRKHARDGYPTLKGTRHKLFLLLNAVDEAGGIDTAIKKLKAE